MWIRQEKGGRYMAFRSEGLRRGLPRIKLGRLPQGQHRIQVLSL